MPTSDAPASQFGDSSSGFWSACAFALLSVLWFPSSGLAQSPEPQRLVQEFAAAWNAHDAEAFGKLFSDQADWVTAPGTRANGRAAIQDFLAREHTTWARTTTMTPTNIVVRSLSADMAVILFEWEIGGATDAAGKRAAPSHGNNLFVASRDRGRWTIVAGQVASRRPRP
jgi:uncharacterized protein (TIGR02246 family)